MANVMSGSSTAGEEIFADSPAAANNRQENCERWPSGGPAAVPIACPAQPAASSSSATTYAPYTIEIGPSTRLLFANRRPAAGTDLSQGDEINVYGYYAGGGAIEADIVRDLSKPTGAVAGGMSVGIGTAFTPPSSGPTSSAPMIPATSSLE